MIKLNFKILMEKEKKPGVFPGSSVVKNPPANTGDTGSVPSPGRSHVLQSPSAHVAQLLSLCPRAWESQPPSPCVAAAEACAP